MNKKYLPLGLAMSVILILTLATARDKTDTQTDSAQLKVTASFYPLYFFTSEIGGNKVEVINITPAGVEPHDYEPTVDDIINIKNSQILILNGGGLEVWSESLKQNIDKDKTTVVTLADNTTNLDPHIWLSPILAKKMADKIIGALIAKDSGNRDYYMSNGEDLKTRLDELDANYKKGLSDCAGKDIITSHTAFSYMAQTYGFNQVSIAGLSPDAEPSPLQLASIAKFAKDNRVRYIFFESLVSPKLSETIASEIGAKTLVLNPLEGLTQEEMESDNNYFTEMERNLANLQIALRCQI